jgi:hypothetical protein
MAITLLLQNDKLFGHILIASQRAPTLVLTTLSGPGESVYLKHIFSSGASYKIPLRGTSNKAYKKASQLVKDHTLPWVRQTQIAAIATSRDIDQRGGI